jgi:hypothetical protein
VSLSGRDALGSAAFLADALSQWPPPIPVMLDIDGQRPDALRALDGHFVLAQVTHDFAGPAGTLDRALETLRMAASLQTVHALVLTPAEVPPAGQILRAVEAAHVASAGTIIVVHPPSSAEPGVLDRRWGVLLEQAARLHADVRLGARIPPPVGMR